MSIKLIDSYTYNGKLDLAIYRIGNKYQVIMHQKGRLATAEIFWASPLVNSYYKDELFVLAREVCQTLISGPDQDEISDEDV